MLLTNLSKINFITEAADGTTTLTLGVTDWAPEALRLAQLADQRSGRRGVSVRETHHREGAAH